MSTFSVNLGWFPAFGDGEGVVRPHQAPDAAGDRARRRRRWRSSRASTRVERARRGRPRARADRGQPRHARARSIVRRHVLRNAAIPITTVAGITIASLIALAGGRRARVQPQRARRVPRRRPRRRRTSPSCRASRWCSWRRSSSLNTIVDLLYALLDPRVAAREPGGMSVIAAAPCRARRAVAAARGIPGLRGTGVIGHVAAVVIVLAALVAVFGSWLDAARPRPDQPLRRLRRLDERSPARLRQPGPRPRSRACWSAPGRRCSGR